MSLPVILTNSSFDTTSKWNCCWMGRRAPETTPVSYPNRKPPIADSSDSRTTYAGVLGFDCSSLGEDDSVTDSYRWSKHGTSGTIISRNTGRYRFIKQHTSVSVADWYVFSSAADLPRRGSASVWLLLSDITAAVRIDDSFHPLLPRWSEKHNRMRPSDLWICVRNRYHRSRVYGVR